MIRVLIIGQGFPDWGKAIQAGAPVWACLPEVAEVVHLPSATDWSMLTPNAPGLRTVVIPLLENDVKACLQHPEIKPLALMPTDQALKTLHDKARFAHYMLAQGMGKFQPEMYRYTHELKFPVAIKRTALYAGAGIARADNLAQFNEIRTQPEFAGKSILACEWIEGRLEYVTHAIVVKGRVQWHQSFEYSLEPEQVVRRGSSIRKIRPIKVSDHALRVFEAVLLPLNYSGMCNIDFKLSTQGRLKIFEVNPRFGGSLMRARHVGFLTQALRTLMAPAWYPLAPLPRAVITG